MIWGGENGVLVALLSAPYLVARSSSIDVIELYIIVRPRVHHEVALRHIAQHQTPVFHQGRPPLAVRPEQVSDWLK